MGKFAVGQVVLVQFPHSDLKKSKKRPAVILATVEFENLIICQVTSRSYSSKAALRIEASDFSQGKLPVISFVRPDKLLTVDAVLIEEVVGTLKDKTLVKILDRVKKLFILIKMD